MRVGVFGGTFDPPHLGHLIVAQDACEALALDEVLFVLAAEPPHKRGRPHTPAPLRMEMLQAATAGDPRFHPCDLELRRHGPSFTVDTLRQLRAEHPAAQLFLLIGADQAREFASWREPDEIGRLATVVALSRAAGRVAGGGPEAPEGGTSMPGTTAPTRGAPGAPDALDEPDEPDALDAPDGAAGPARWLPVTRIDISATEVRRRVAAGEPIRYLVPAAVEAVIRRESLYANESPEAFPAGMPAPTGAGAPGREAASAADRAGAQGVQGTSGPDTTKSTVQC